jgi:uncharacterized membrane protein YagU involved in acid resistance
MSSRAVAIGTVIVAVLDITEVILFYAMRGVSPVRILQAVAAGVMGPAAFKGGLGTAAAGLLVHMVIAFVVVCVYHYASARLGVLRRRALAFGALYGLAVYAVMNFVVLPLSATGAPKFTWPVVVNGLFAHIFCVGIPAALTARRAQVADVRAAQTHPA